jgi:pimeloyl-ACP methyl ester carboxylesterase
VIVAERIEDRGERTKDQMMPRATAGKSSVSDVEHGAGDNVVLAVHGNLGCADGLALVLPILPPTIRVIAAEGRGCGDSDEPVPENDYSNHSMDTHARDMRGLLDALGIGRCHLYRHSTGGIICSHMLATQPKRFRKALMVDPFVAALRRIEQENGRMIQAQIRFLKDATSPLDDAERERLIEAEQAPVEEAFGHFLEWPGHDAIA